MTGRTFGGRVRAAGLVLLLGMGLASCTASASESRSATVVLFDVSNSTRDASVRARYEETFGLVLAHLREAGGALGADIIDSNPMVHGDLPTSCTALPSSAPRLGFRVDSDRQPEIYDVWPFRLRSA